MVTDLVERARRIRLVLADCDGVLTDGAVYLDGAGQEMKRFSFRDGMGVARLREAGLEVGIITGEVSEPVRRRAEKLGIDELHEGVKDKLGLTKEICGRLGLPPEAVAYIGDDVNDADVMEYVGLCAAPLDAFPQVRDMAHVVVSELGGMGAFRAFAELILQARSSHG